MAEIQKMEICTESRYSALHCTRKQIHKLVGLKLFAVHKMTSKLFILHERKAQQQFYVLYSILIFTTERPKIHRSVTAS